MHIHTYIHRRLDIDIVACMHIFVMPTSLHTCITKPRLKEIKSSLCVGPQVKIISKQYEWIIQDTYITNNYIDKKISDKLTILTFLSYKKE